MPRPRTTTALNGRKPAVSHAKPPAADPDEEQEHDDDGAGAPGDDIPAGRPPVDALSEMMASLQGASTSRITVYRIVKNQPPSYVFECDPTSFSLDDLRDKYNGGEFRLYVMKDGRLFKNMRVVVEPKQVFHGQEPAAPPTSALSDLVSVMREGFAAQNAALRDALAVRPPSMFAGMDLPAVITAAAAAITALRPPPVPVAPPQPDNSEKALDMFMRGIEIASTMNSGGSDGIGGMLRDVLRSPIVASAVQAAMQPGAQAPRPAQPQLLGPQQAAPQQPTQPADQVSHAKPADIPQEAQTKMLAYYLGFLVGKARLGADASLYAELVLDNVPDAQLTPMLARGDGLIDYLIEVHPPVAEHREWFATLMREINELLEPEAPEETQPAGGPNATDSASIVVPGHAAS